MEVDMPNQRKIMLRHNMEPMEPHNMLLLSTVLLSTVLLSTVLHHLTNKDMPRINSINQAH